MRLVFNQIPPCDFEIVFKHVFDFKKFNKVVSVQECDATKVSFIIFSSAHKNHFLHSPLTTNYSRSHSVLKLFTGFAIAAFIAWKLTVISAINNVNNPHAAKSHQLIPVLKVYP